MAASSPLLISIPTFLFSDSPPLSSLLIFSRIFSFFYKLSSSLTCFLFLALSPSLSSFPEPFSPFRSLFYYLAVLFFSLLKVRSFLSRSPSLQLPRLLSYTFSAFPFTDSFPKEFLSHLLNFPLPIPFSLFHDNLLLLAIQLSIFLLLSLSETHPLFRSLTLSLLSLAISLSFSPSLPSNRSHTLYFPPFSSLFFSLASALFLLPLESPVLSSTSLVLVRYIFLSFVSLNLSPLSDFSPLSCNRTVAQSLTFAPPPSTILYLLLSLLHALWIRVPLCGIRGEKGGRMVKAMRLDFTPRSLRQQYTCAKFLICVLLVGLSVLLLLFSSWVISPSGEQATKPSGNGESLFSLLR